MADSQSIRAAWRDLGRQLAARRRAAGLNQESLGERTLYSRSSIANIETGLQHVNRSFWENADRMLGAGGELVRGYDSAKAQQRTHQRPGSSAWNPEWADQIRRGVAAPSRNVGTDFLDVVRLQLETAKMVDGRYGPAAALSTANGVIDVVESVAPDMPDRLRDAALAVGAEAAEFIGWLFRDLAELARATYWYDRAMEYAQLCGDAPMQGFILLRKSQMAYESRSGHQVRLFARAAIEGPWRLSSRFHAEALLQVARGDLMVGQTVDVDRAVGRAREVADGEDLTLREASCWIEAGQPGRAVQLYEDGLTGEGVSLRDAGYFRSRQAMALARVEEPDLAADRARQALSASVRTGSLRTRRTVKQAHSLLSRWQASEAVTVLADALSRLEQPPSQRQLG
ncbi:helix-turn-helix domain-containing protein [Krasilnikovia sp. MM14-A1004]|uniref:helix-turn-helix domain-containing protein n=1 Tax=Krasilnikovia sp. MM14-A1004 TaxID=3373541 RepID=UPI00399D17B7